jgi:hypothetical protein
MEIPSYPASRPLNIADKQLFDQLCNDLQPRISELTFAGLYLFRNAHGYLLSLLADSVIVSGNGYDGSPYFLPPLGGDSAAAIRLMLADGHSLYGADDRFVIDCCTTADQITELRDSADYLYLREELATLPGSRFHKKKNRINYFTSRHDYTVTLYTPEQFRACQALLDIITANSPTESASFKAEMAATAEALKNYTQLGLEGVVVVVENRIVAFALGERLNRDTAVCHFEKADPFIEGLYQLVNREFARLLFQECRYLNREQDLGETGLRSAKLSYHPVKLVKKYLVSAVTK